LLLSRGADGKYDPIDDGGSFARGDLIFARERADKLFSLWAGHLWQLHGKDRNAALGLGTCWSGEANCGVVYDWPKKQAGRNLARWHVSGKGDDYLDISNIRFYPLDTNDAGKQAKFENMISSLAMGWYGNIGEPSTEGYYWLANYAVKTGQAQVYANALAELRQGRLRGNSPDVKKIRERASRDIYIDQGRQWDAMWAKASLTEAEQRVLEALSRRTNRLPQYANRYVIRDYESISRLCEMGYGGFCKQIEAAAAADQARRNAVANFFNSPPPSATVSVRVYDQNGNYQGTKTTTRTEAELLGARPQ
jgi:hypothetical protein